MREFYRLPETLLRPVEAVGGAMAQRSAGGCGRKTHLGPGNVDPAGRTGVWMHGHVGGAHVVGKRLVKRCTLAPPRLAALWATWNGGGAESMLEERGKRFSSVPEGWH